MRRIIIEDPNEKALIEEVSKRNDIKAERIKRFLTLSDLTKKENSPIKILVDRILDLPRFANFDIVEIPKITTVEREFDILNSPKDHPSRKETDTFFLDDTNHLRTQMTVMWSYYLTNKEILEKLERDGEVMALAPGLVYRKDEIDRKHFPAFHQIDGLWRFKKGKKSITLGDL